MNNINIAGKIGKYAVTRFTQSGKQVTSFSVADDQGYGDNKQTIWYDCVIWGERGEKLEQYLVKGQAVTVSGTLGTREHDGKTYLTVRVGDVALQGGKSDKPKAEPKPVNTAPAADPFSDDVPF